MLIAHILMFYERFACQVDRLIIKRIGIIFLN